MGTMLCPVCRVQLEFRPTLGGVFGDGSIVPNNLQVVTLSKAIAALLDAKAKANLRAKYLTGLRQYLTLFAAGREGLALRTITTDTLDRWFAERKEAPRTMASNIGRLRSLFSFALRRGWITENPCDQLEKVRLDQPDAPRILTPDECRKILDTCPVNCLPFFVLALFAGIRPEEIHALEWADIRHDLKAVLLNKGKTRKRRVVPLLPVALEWLAVCDKSLPLCPSAITVRRARRKLRAILGESWPQDCLRHTAASYLLSLHKDAGKVALTLGNSERILLRHYHNLVSEESTAQFFNLKPKSP
ncbi:MAG: hypothetical protein EB141_12850 [Verrucomicrobia bacterium]|nr:hypothetical protein [Pseudomonadota bacterium]NDB76508.1 hypothetical protein [Verrucomicrobiota bacterium]NDD39514.1 hypothetical protein [Verrucomicrobiota bacterium]NDE98293.1 hypothetical protein [Verrucomicrobiota bacterium]